MDVAAGTDDATAQFLDADNRLATLSKRGDRLAAIARLVPWEDFCAEIEAVVLTADSDKKGSATLVIVADSTIATGGTYTGSHYRSKQLRGLYITSGVDCKIASDCGSTRD